MMEQKLKERLVGAAVLVAIAVIFIPIILTDSPETESISGSNIPEKPETTFNSRIIPVIEDGAKILSNTTEDMKLEPKDIEPKDIESEKIQEKNIQDIIVEKVVSDNEKVSSKKEAVKNEVQNEVKNDVKVDVGLSAWIVQLGSFSDEENAESLNEKLRKEGYPAFVEPLKKNGKMSYRVRVGPEIKRSEADLLLKRLKEKMKLDGIVVSYP
ncbi:MAG: DedD protein [Gammaproteobacteria bacterium]|jgi:DedD protein